jgi:hypothetical protein
MRTFGPLAALLAAVVLARAASAGEGCACCSRSAAAHAALEIRWETVTRVSPAAGESVAADARPVFAFVSDGGESARLVDSAVLKDERIALGLRAFRPVRITPEDAAKDPLLAGAGKAPLRLVVVSADATRATPLERGKVAVAAVWEALRAEADRTWEQDLAATVGKARDLLGEYDRIAADRKALEGVADAPDAAARRAALDERERRAKEAEAGLWALRRKAA